MDEIGEINPTAKKLPNKFVYIDLESVVNGELVKEQEINLYEAPSRAQRLLERNDILFQMVRPYQKNNFFFDRIGSYVASTGYAQLRTDENPKFVYHYLHFQKFVDKIIEKCTGTSYPAINSTDFANTIIATPSIPEQEKIASFLSLIDDRISAQSKIIEELKLLKNYLNRKIFTRQLRISPIKDKWRKIRLGEISTRITTKNKEHNQNVLTISAQFGLISQLDFFNKSIASKDISGYYLLQKGDFAYNKSYSSGYPMGAIKKLNYYDKGAVSTLYICFRFSNDINSKFMEQYFESGIHNVEIEKIAQEGGRNHGLLNIGISDFFDIQVYLPGIEEQNRIANFLSFIDEKIETEKKILQQYENQKKYLLKNMFI